MYHDPRDNHEHVVSNKLHVYRTEVANLVGESEEAEVDSRDWDVQDI